MKASKKFLVLMAALSAGAAMAAAPPANPNGYTTSGTGITNVATASFTDPATAGTATSTSNTVTTTVLPLPSFDLVYDSGSADGGGTATNPANSISASTPDQAANVKPGSTTPNVYWAVNNGNTPITVTITPNLGGTTGESVTYTYVDPVDNTTKTSAANTAFTITIPAGATGTVKLTQNTTVPTTAAAGALFGASPQGVATVANNAGRGLPADMYEDQRVISGAVTGAANGTDLQFQALNIYSSNISNTPTPPGAGTATVPGTTATPPASVPGYTAPAPTAPPAGAGTPGTTPVQVSGNQQFAYPPADTNTGADVVVFKNTVTNGGALNDIITLTPVSYTGVTGAFTKTGTGTYTGTDAAGKTVTIQFTDTAGTLIDTLPVAAGGTGNYYTQVTYPDSNSLPNQNQIDVVVKATSGNNANVSSTTTDSILPPASQFGDQSGETGSGATLTENPGTVYSQTGVPGATGTYPMRVANTGTYTDSFTVTGYVVVPLASGTNQTVPVVYSGTGVTQTGTTTVNGVTVNVYTVSNVAPRTAATVTGTVTIPVNAAANTLATAPTLQQTATGVNSTTAMQDLNDPLVVSPLGSVVIGKFTQSTAAGTPAVNTQKVVGNPGTASTGAPAAADVGNPAGYDGVNNQSYLPQQQYSYRIIAKNNYNANVANFALSDVLNGNLQYVSATCTVYAANGTTVVSNPAPTGPAAGTSGTVSCAAVTLASGQTEVLDITVKIK